MESKNTDLVSDNHKCMCESKKFSCSEMAKSESLTAFNLDTLSSNITMACKGREVLSIDISKVEDRKFGFVYRAIITSRS